jgi:transcriptional regulator with XRE-family HTH domain
MAVHNKAGTVPGNATVTLGDLRRQAGLTQIELARQVGVSVSTIGKLECGQAVPTWETVKGLARVLGLSPIMNVRFASVHTQKTGRKPSTRVPVSTNANANAETIGDRGVR